MAEPLAVVCTAAENYAAQLRVLAASFLRFHPGIPFYALLIGSSRCAGATAGLPVRPLRLADLGDGGMAGMKLRYAPKQFAAAIKPHLLLHLLNRGHRTAVFLDPDMLVLAPLTPFLDLAAAHALTLTPHVVPEAALRPDAALERSLLGAGMFNGGVMAVSAGEPARSFLLWWAGRLRVHCREETWRGIHYDQRWLDLAPGFVEDLCVCRDPGCNADYWRLPWLEWELRGDAISVNGGPLRLFHFSGYDPSRPHLVTRFRPQLRVDELGPAGDLFERYQQLLLDAGWRQWSRRPWPWPMAHSLYHFARLLPRRLRIALRAISKT